MAHALANNTLPAPLLTLLNSGLAAARVVLLLLLLLLRLC
jgi:hypothetical protein